MGIIENKLTFTEKELTAFLSIPEFSANKIGIAPSVQLNEEEKLEALKKLEAFQEPDQV